MEVYDPIHGNIYICETAKKIIDTIEFQRLRNIKQLGCCYYVFPGASHNRFEHSIGVYHLAKKYIDILNTNKQISEREALCISIAALIHDLGHGPYSHLFDELFSKEKHHEYRSYQLFKQMNSKYELGFTDKEVLFIKDIIHPENITDTKKYLYQIVSNNNGIDVDRFDYINRDIHMIGLNYGIEYERIMKHSKIENNNIIYSEKVKNVIENFFRTRFLMYQEVYNHRTVRCIEYMMKEYITSLDKCLSIQEIIETDNWNKFIEITDSIIDYPPSLCEDISKEILHNIKTRRIYKLAGELVVSTNELFDDIPSEVTNNIIIDKVSIKYYGKEKCQFYTDRCIINKETFSNNDLFIIAVYYKQEYCQGDIPFKIFREIVKYIN